MIDLFAVLTVYVVYPANKVSKQLYKLARCVSTVNTVGVGFAAGVPDLRLTCVVFHVIACYSFNMQCQED